MRRCSLDLVLIFALITCIASAPAETVKPKPSEPLRRLYVSSRGDDSNDGLSPEKAFQTISRAAMVVEPGDLVMVAGGTYFEHVHLMRPGTAENPIVFQAAPGETALVTFGRRPVGWKKVAGTRSTYSVDYTTAPNYVWEDRTVTRYVSVQDMTTLDDMPGSFLYDQDKQLLSVHPLRGLSPADVGIVVVDYAERGYEFDKGFWSRAPHNRVEGFMIAYQPIGIQIRADNCEAWNNTVYGCLSGVTIYRGKNCVIANNTCYRNDRYGVHVGSYAENIIVRGNFCWDNGPMGPFKHSGSGGHPHNMALYGGATDVSFIGNTVIAEPGQRLWRYKSARGKVVTTDNILVGGTGHVNWGQQSLYANNTIVGGVWKIRHGKQPIITPETARQFNSEARGNLYIENAADANKAGFADLSRHDYRLLADSPHLNSGAFPQAGPLRYVSPLGSDEQDGRTPGTAWRTLSKAASSVMSGQTVYVQPGVYQESLRLSCRGMSARPIFFKTYGRGQVILDGDGQEEYGVVLRRASHLSIDGFIIKGYRQAAVRIEGSEDIQLIENIFDGAEVGVLLEGAQNVSVLNNTFHKCREVLKTENVKGLIIRNSLFADISETPVVLDDATFQGTISERNAFSGPNAGSQLRAWQRRIRESHPSLSAEVGFSDPNYILPVEHHLGFTGLGHMPIGARGAASDTSPIPVEDFRAVTVFPDQAVVAWKTPYDYPGARLSWMSREGKKKTLSVDQEYGLKQTTLTARLTDLQPGAHHLLKLEVHDSDGRSGRARLEFETPESHRAPTTLYVSPTGDDGNDGKTWDRPLKTLSAASFAASPGGTILVSPGIYRETLTLRCGGLSKGQRLTFRSTQPGKAIIDSGELRPSAIVIKGVKHVVIDGFRMRGFLYSSLRYAVNVRNTQDLLFVNNVFDTESTKGVSCILFHADHSRDIVIRDNLFQSGFANATLWNCDDVTVDHNTFYGGGTMALQLHGEPDAVWRITNNIFVDVIASNKSNAAINISKPSKNVVCDYNLYWRKDSPKMGMLGFRQKREGEPIPHGAQDAKTIEDMRRMFGFEHHGLFGDPLFVDLEKGDYRLDEGSPAVGMSMEGKMVGMRNPPRGLR